MMKSLHPEVLALKQALALTGWQFRIRELQRTFALSLEVLEARLQDADSIVRARWHLEPDDPIPPAEYDNEGRAAPDFFEELEWLEHSVNAAIGQMRVSAVVALFHAFEQMMNAHRGETDFKMKESLDVLRKLGCIPDKDGLQVVRLAANAAKHGRGESARKLQKRRPDLFSGDDLVLSDETLKSFFQTVTTSLARPS